ncbi:phosphoribosylaminoimidazole-succinocarboxamide synthase [Protomyces lactucae-debilis]|uniref:Phosphoribosylaminoimidazole-succinocarboxamide synthase n=1 Tax=Protomyces lactucae-debilis TaxID=2754530 RepID=A0A1Y2EVA3_PROLT|nr:phosphoribosylaminoimidazole-succinocarboxamide synthase [Protomyces lactucae-debilis]ORY75489.1 phosphoribosylaminoimidazole-succinocarboxamide synthase [Protomyces lactucae-debilis]
MPAKVQPYKSQLVGRSMLVRKLQILPIEAIVRGYITGSAWKEYKTSGTVHGLHVPAGMQESEAFAQPIFTPSTKAEQGDHDENIHPSKVAGIIGKQHAARMEELALSLYSAARDYAATKGIIIADTKFEFGLDDAGEMVLVDEVLTPDSSRFWPADKYKVGQPQESFDKQYLRDWLTENKIDKKEGVEVPAHVVQATMEKYSQVYQLLTGKRWEDVQEK